MILSSPSLFECLAGVATLFLSHSALARVIEVPPGPASAISDAVAIALPGDVVQLLPGVYEGTVNITRSGQPDLPITIAGPSGEEKAIIDGGGTPSLTSRGFQAFVIRNSSWIHLKDITTRNCWMNIIDIHNSSYISVEGFDFQGSGNTAVSAHGPETHHILIESCNWYQDARIYSEWDWAEVHHGTLKFYNGGLYGGTNAGGGSVIRFNNVRDVFNGLRWWIGPSYADEKRHHDNIEIYENTFTRCRDNCIEPELFAWNLHVYHNTLNSCPSGIFSIDGVAGGEIYIYGNVGYWNSEDRPSPANGVEAPTTAWAVYKFANYKTKSSLTSPLYIYQNSYSHDRVFPFGSKIRKAEDYVTHYNNAYFHQNNERGMGLDEWPGLHCSFDYDISSASWSPDVIRLGFEQNGIPNTDPLFVNPPQGDFRLQTESKAIDAGKVIEGFTLWHTGKAPNMGAYEGDQLVYGKPFVHHTPPGGALYQEKPRIVRIFTRGERLVIYFSAPIAPASFTPHSLILQTEAGQTVEIEAAEFPNEGGTEAVSLTLKTRLPQKVASLKVAFGSDHPVAINGEKATLWAGDTRVVRIPEDATLVGEMVKLLPSPEPPKQEESAQR